MKKLVLASDHAGFKLKNEVKEHFQNHGYEVIDLGNKSEIETVSYAKQGQALAEKVLETSYAIGLGFCGTGLGISFAVNRYHKIRGARVTSEEDAKLAKKHNNANILLLGGRQIESKKAISMIETFLETDYEGGRHQKRIEELDN